MDYTRLPYIIGYKLSCENLAEPDSMSLNELIKNGYNLIISSQKCIITLLALLLIIIIIAISLIKSKRALISANLKLIASANLISEYNKREEVLNQTILLMESISIRYLEILKEVPLIKYKFPQRTQEYANEIFLKINQIIYEGDTFNWDIFYDVANIAYNGYFDKVKDKFPQLNNKDLIIYCLTYLKMRNNEIAKLLEIEISTIANRKTSIRKKLEMGEEQNIPDFIDKHLYN